MAFTEPASYTALGRSSPTWRSRREPSCRLVRRAIDDGKPPRRPPSTQRVRSRRPAGAPRPPRATFAAGDRAVDRPPNRWRPAMVRIDVTIVISRPVQEVWDFFIDFTNSSHWTRSGSELRQTSEGPVGVGTTVESVRPMFGREIKSQRLVATRYEPPHLV